jgi:hypothetical protein
MHLGQDTVWIMSIGYMRTPTGCTYTRKVAVLPEQGAAKEEEVLKIEHGGHGVGKETQEVWERDMGDAIGWKVLPTTREEAHTKSCVDLPVQTQ